MTSLSKRLGGYLCTFRLEQPDIFRSMSQKIISWKIEDSPCTFIKVSMVLSYCYLECLGLLFTTCCYFRRIPSKMSLYTILGKSCRHWLYRVSRLQNSHCLSIKHGLEKHCISRSLFIHIIAEPLINRSLTRRSWLQPIHIDEGPTLYCIDITHRLQ